MRYTVWVAGLVAVVGCQSAQSASPDTLKDELLKIQTKCTSQNDRAFLVVEELSSRVAKLQQTNQKLETRADAAEIEIRRLNEKLERLAPGPTQTGTPVPTPEPDAPEPAPTAMKPEEAMREVENQIARLRQGSAADEVVRALLPHAKYAAPKACEALREAIRDVEFMKRLEAVLAKMPPEDLRSPIAEALKEGVRRYPAARIIGETRDRELGRLLEPFTGDVEMGFCYTAGYSLLQCQNRLGVPALIRALRSDDKQTRMLSLYALRKVSGNETFAYDFAKDPPQNEKAIQAWEAWYEKNGPKLFP